MAKRSDLAQKLLDDLRLRKEQMATSHTSNYSKKMPRSSSEGVNFRKPMQGSRSVKTHETINSSMGDQSKWFGTKHNRPVINEGASKEIVPVGRARNSENIGNLSMALTFALENGCTLGKLTSSGNSVLGFLHHIGRSVDLGLMERSSSSSSIVSSRPSNSNFHTLSHLHIKEIAKGIQKLNEILGACTNEVNFDRYSVDFGKELLKGAMELDKSLRILVNLQEASEYIIRPQRKQRIRLLKDEDDDGTIKGNKHKQVSQLKSSFNGPSRSYPGDAQKVTKASLLKQQLLTLSYPTETAHSSSNNHTPTISSGSVSHSRSASCSPDSSALTASSEPPMKRSNSSLSKTGKGRIPNVIAKLMGLEELPPNTVPKNGAEKDRVLKPEKVRTDAKETGVRVKKEEKTPMDYKSPSSHRSQDPRLQGLHANYATPNTSLGLAADEFLVPRNGNLEFMFHEETPNFRDPKHLENMNFLSISKPTIKINKLQMNANQLSKITGIQQDKQGKERKQEKPNPRDWETIEKGVNSEAFFSDDLQRMVPQSNKNQEAADSNQNKGNEKHIHHKEKKNADIVCMSSNQQKAPHDGCRQPQESDTQGAKLHQEGKRSQNRKSKLQVNNPKGNGALLKNSLKPTPDRTNLQKKLPHMDHAATGMQSSKEAFNTMPSEGSRKSGYNEDLTNDGISTNHKLNIHSPDRRSGAQTDTDVKRVKVSTPPRMLSEAVLVQPRQEKLSSRDMHQRVNSQKRDRKVDEVVTRENRSTNTRSRPLKQQILVLQQLKQQKVEETHRLKKAETSISMSRKAKTSKPMNLAPQEKAEPNSTFNNHVGDSCQTPRDMGAIAPHAINNDKTSGLSNSLQAPVPMLDKDEVTPSNSMSVQLKGASKEGMLGITKSSQPEHQKTFGTQSSLTENEYHLKQILLGSPIFLNTAEALLGLLIPVDILHVSAHTCKDDDSKLVLDYCYEVMKRKGRRKELTFHPCLRISSGSVMPKGLDDLVKALHKNLEDLKLFNLDSSNEYEVAISFNKMLERDIQNKNPDLNCMWDFGWSVTMLAYPEKDEVIQDVEKFVLNGLIDEILEDILQEPPFNGENKTKQ